MKILVTGGAGFIGTNVVRFLLQETDHRVIVVDKLTYAGNLESLADVAESERFQFFQADIADAESVEKVFAETRPDAVMHLAAESHVDRSIDGPGQFIQTNLVGTYVLLQAARKHYEELPTQAKEKFRFLHVSTDEVYGSLGFSDPAFQETTAYDPHSPYSATKAGSDHLARAWHSTYGLPVLITNCSNNYGPYQFPEKLIPVVILRALQGEPIPVYGKGENVRDWLYVEDHARALHHVLTTGRLGETYNIGGDNELKNIDLVRQICTLLDELHPIAENSQLTPAQRGSLRTYAELITFVKDRPGHDLRYAIDATKIKAELGWKPREDFQSGFRKTVQWYLDNKTWWQRILSGEYELERQGLSLQQEEGANS